ncbi:glycosyltransferase family 2 protein [Comamonas sp. J-3]|uniref:glycosyltransferase family 2 protein n=1 Tax=Comamonas trifloxystrobinivorans TaxID=3350256 RepID=UPI00372CBC0F
MSDSPSPQPATTTTNSQRPPLRLSCVVPAYNEAANLEAFLPALHQVVSGLAAECEIVLINDGSQDETHETALRLAQQLPLQYVQLSRNFGKEAALSAGLDYARGNAVLLIDADFQHPLPLVTEMVQLWHSGYDVVYGVITDRSDERASKRWGTRLFYYLMNRNSRFQIPKNAGDFRLMDRKVVDVLRQLPERNRFMKGLYAWAGFKSVALPFVPDARRSGQSSFNLHRLASLAFEGLTSFTTIPLRVWSLAGFCISLAAILYGIYITIETLIFDNPTDGWPTLAAGLMLFSGVQLMSIGMLGEYIGRIYEEVKRRPLYVVDQHVATHALSDTRPATAAAETPAPAPSNSDSPKT